MNDYLIWDNQKITDFSEKNINELYSQGFLFTREGKGEMYETRSVRVDLSKFELSSENRRVLRKTEKVKMEIISLPHPAYDWRIAKFGHDYYTKKFGDKTFSANKIKELLTDDKKSNFNLLLEYHQPVVVPTIRQPAEGIQSSDKIGYAICYSNKEIIHYSYPFYNSNSDIHNLGIGMMTRAIVWAQENGKKYVYLGSVKDSAALYKFQFKGVEWWDGKMWNDDIDKIKQELK